MTANRTTTQMRQTINFWERVFDDTGFAQGRKMLGSNSLTHRYLQLCAIARRLEDSDEHNSALKMVRPTRLIIEQEVQRRGNLLKPSRRDDALFRGDLFGASSKQGVSFRLGLESCQPTRLCQTLCYAHDGNDCFPQPVIRGALNSIIAQEYEHGSSDRRAQLTKRLIPHARAASRRAVREMLQAREHGFLRAPRVRFSHVGDIACYPEFANALGWEADFHMRLEIDKLGPWPDPLARWPSPVIVTYTRRAINRLNPGWTILSSCDPSTTQKALDTCREMQRQRRARVAWCAFQGQASPQADVTFAEHHGPRRLEAAGEGFVCPSTRRSNPIHGCDANRCDLCFRPM